MMILWLILCAFDLRVDTVISRNEMNEVFCALQASQFADFFRRTERGQWAAQVLPK